MAATNDPLLPSQSHVQLLPAGEVPSHDGVFATRDHAIIRGWAEGRHAQPATGEATPTGPSKIDVNDGTTGIRFNFPGAAAFRPITWQEWFGNFERYRLAFVFEETQGSPASMRFRLVPADELVSVAG